MYQHACGGGVLIYLKDVADKKLFEERKCLRNVLKDSIRVSMNLQPCSAFDVKMSVMFDTQLFESMYANSCRIIREEVERAILEKMPDKIANVNRALRYNDNGR